MNVMRTQQERTIYQMNMQICGGRDCEDNMWPVLEPTDTIPHGLTTFQVSTSYDHPEDFCHFYIDDYRFERIWQTPERYVNVLKRYDGVIAPDFSTYTDMPYPMQMWNVYRSRALAHYWQQCGIDVIPNVQFSDKRSYEWAFDGLPFGATLATSSVGVAKRKEWRDAFVEGMEECCRRCEPFQIIAYGKPIEFDALGAMVVWYENDNDRRMRDARENRTYR